MNLYSLIIIKRKIENIFIYPFILIGRFIAFIKPLNKEYETFFFFSFYHLGGADKVHYQIARATGGKNAIIFFTKKSKNNLYYEFFKKSNCRLIDVSKFTDNKFLYFNNLIFRGILSGYINKQSLKPIVFNGQCNFAYKLSPWINKHIPQIELIHSLCSFSYIRIPFIEYYFKTVMISNQRILDHKKLYERYKIPSSYKKNIVFILNGIALPTQTKKFAEQPINPLKILYVGRDTEEKRVNLIAQIAKEIKEEKKLNADFIFMGEVANAIPEELHKYCIFLGNQTDEKKIAEIYLNADVLLMVSTTEGFPMAIMEAMSYGLTIVSTAVGEIPLHVQNGINGFLISEVKNNALVVKNALEIICNIINNSSQLSLIGKNNIQHAFANFGLDKFSAAYKKLFAEAREQFHD